MNTDIVKGKWHQIKGKARAQWGKLTDDELERIGGDSEQLVGLVQERYGYERDKARREVDAFLDRESAE